MNLTELLATPMIYLPTATRLGVVVGFALDERLRRVSHVVVVDEDSYCRESLYRWRNVAWGESVLLTSADKVEDSPKRIPFREVVLDTDGKGYGYLKEVVCDEKGRIQSVVTTEEELSPEKLLRMGDVILLKGSRRVSRPAKAQVAAVENETVVEDAFTAVESGPRRVAGDYTFLLGRTIKSDLIDKGEVLLQQGSVITEDTIDMARQYGLLLPLTVLSR